MALKKNTKNPEDFWRDYEEKTGEKVMARCLGQYVSGWEEFEGTTGLWGLIIFTSGGFRFHHFPQHNWLESMIRSSSHEEPKEKTIFIPKEKIISARYIEEKSWWKKIFRANWPHLSIIYNSHPDNSDMDNEGRNNGETKNEKRLLFEAESKSGNFSILDYIRDSFSIT